MEKYVFLYKECVEDRDCCAYIETTPKRWECDHYFGSVILHGACYSKHDFANYEDIKTILTEDEYNQLIKFSKDIEDLGYGITKDITRALNFVRQFNLYMTSYCRTKTKNCLMKLSKKKKSI